jgi:hypothetical protein
MDSKEPLSSEDKPPPEKGLPKATIQIIALLTGVIGVTADYVFKVMGDEHLPLILYGLCFGVAWGLDPTLWVTNILGRK